MHGIIQFRLGEFTSKVSYHRSNSQSIPRSWRGTNDSRSTLFLCHPQHPTAHQRCLSIVPDQYAAWRTAESPQADKRFGGKLTRVSHRIFKYYVQRKLRAHGWGGEEGGGGGGSTHVVHASAVCH